MLAKFNWHHGLLYMYALLDFHIKYSSFEAKENTTVLGSHFEGLMQNYGNHIWKWMLLQ